MSDLSRDIIAFSLIYLMITYIYHFLKFSFECKYEDLTILAKIIFYVFEIFPKIVKFLFVKNKEKR